MSLLLLLTNLSTPASLSCHSLTLRYRVSQDQDPLLSLCPSSPSFATYSVAAMGPSLCIIWLVFFFFNYIYFNLHFKCCILSQFPTPPETPYQIQCHPATIRVILHMRNHTHIKVRWLTSLSLCILIIQHHIGDPAAYREKMSRF